ncbi:MAG: hypothetical protein Q8P95_03070 [bacterium]|nr:hypothetical protein [bacterium]
MIMEHVDIINVAGLMMNGRDDGIEKALREAEVGRSVRTIAPTPYKLRHEGPEDGIARTGQLLEQAIADIDEQDGNSRIVVVGRSYGGFMALMAAVRREFYRIFRVVLIEGPLHPDVEVGVPWLIPPLKACRAHYEARSELAREAVDYLASHGTSQVVIVQGGGKDSVVPVDAQALPGNFESTEWDGKGELAPANGQGRIVRLSPRLAGLGLSPRRLLPGGYRNHLFWKPEKMEAVVRIISHSCSDHET